MDGNLNEPIDDFFGKEPTVGEKAWDIINQFYRLFLTKLEEDGISRADLARRVDKSRAVISHMFNKTLNITPANIGYVKGTKYRLPNSNEISE